MEPPPAFCTHLCRELYYNSIDEAVQTMKISAQVKPSRNSSAAVTRAVQPLLQLKHFTISGLFGASAIKDIAFPVLSEEPSTPSIVILHGRNGVGKTTILRMLEGLLRLDFNVFRQVPFETCSLSFDSDACIEVRSHKKGQALLHLEVVYRAMRVILHPQQPGPALETDSPKVDVFRQNYFKETANITFDFIDTERLHHPLSPETQFEGDATIAQIIGRQVRQVVLHRQDINPKARAPIDQAQSLAARVRRFIREAQVNYRAFFSTTEPDLFPRIIERLTASEQPVYATSQLRQRLEQIHLQEKRTQRFGLEPDRWDFDQLLAQLKALSQRPALQRQQALTVLGSYVEQLESRAAERALVADRLLIFERLMKEFFGDKSVFVDPEQGFVIQTGSGESLEERQLSSGEFHLLFLMVAALVTKRRGTVIAIDEPEMSMHLSWQRKLVPALVECASKAEPLFIFATHSPDLAASFPGAMKELT